MARRAKKDAEKKIVVVEWSIGIGLNGCTQRGEWEFDEAEWNAMSKDEQTKQCEEYMQDELGNYLDYGWSVKSGDS